MFTRVFERYINDGALEHISLDVQMTQKFNKQISDEIFQGVSL